MSASPLVLYTLFGVQAWIVWLILAAAFLVLEASTVNLVSIWFVVGCLGALAVDLLGGGIWLQVLVMLILSGILLFVFLRLRPHLGLSGREVVPTNADRFIGQTGLVIEDIDPVAGRGQVRSLGQIWSAVSIDASRIPAGTLTVIVEIRGVHAVVRREEIVRQPAFHFPEQDKKQEEQQP